MTVWEKITVQDLVVAGEAEVKTGPFGTQLHASDYVDEGIPVINVRNIGFGEIKAQDLEYISEATARRLSSHLLQSEDIVFGRKGGVERHAFIKKAYVRWFQGSDCLRLRINSPRVIPRFISYQLLCEDHKKWMMNQCSHGATMASLNQDIVKRIPLNLPLLSLQRKIVSILSAYDDLIENNLRRIKVLEEMAQTLYREWFFKFRFPGHQKVKMVNSPLGRIPEGWRVISLDEIMDFQGGAQPPKSEWSETPRNGFVRMIQIRDYQSDNYVCYVNESKKLRRCLREDIMIARYGASVARICWGLEGAYNVALVRVIPGKTHYREYLRTYLQSEAFQVLLIGMSGRTAQAGFNKSNLKSILLPFPIDGVIIDKYQKLVEPLRSLELTLEGKNRTLRQTRDLLLPKLISGELDVSELDIAIPEAKA